MLYISKTILKILILITYFIIIFFYPLEISCSNSKREVKANNNEKVNHLTIEYLKEKAANINSKITKQKAKLNTFNIKEKNILKSLNDADFALNKARNSVSTIKKEIVSIEHKIKEINKSYIYLVEEIKTNEEYVSKRLIAFYKLCWLSKINIIASAKSVSEIFQRENALESILKDDDENRKKLINNKSKVKHMLDIMNNKKKGKINLEQALIKQINIISLKKEKRSKLLYDIRNKKALEIDVIASLKNSATELDQTMQALSSEFKSFKQFEKIKTKNFTSFKGLLNLPVKGKIISSFGPYKTTKFNVKHFRSGIDIKADRGEPISAIYDGLIIYSNWFKGYGNMIVIAHGENYYSVYAHIEESFKTKGDKIEKNEIIATVGDTGSMVGSGLYFELRHHGKPMNPLEWLKKV